jgi:hypothetical protein
MTIFTDVFVRQIKPDPSKRLQFADSHSDGRGLVLRVSPKGEKIFGYRYGSPTKYCALGRYPDMTLAKAREARGEAADKVARGEDRRPPRRQKRMLARLCETPSPTLSGCTSTATVVLKTVCARARLSVFVLVREK